MTAFISVSQSQQQLVDSGKPTKRRSERLFNGHEPDSFIDENGNRSGISTKQQQRINRQIQGKAKSERASRARARNCKGRPSDNDNKDKSSVIPISSPNFVPGPSGSHVVITAKKKVPVDSHVISNKDKIKACIEPCKLIRIYKAVLQLPRIDSKNKNHQYIYEIAAKYLNKEKVKTETAIEPDGTETETDATEIVQKPLLRSSLFCKINSKETDETETEIVQKPKLRSSLSCKINSKETDETETGIVQKPMLRSSLSCKINSKETDETETGMVQKPKLRSSLSCKNKSKDADETNTTITETELVQKPLLRSSLFCKNKSKEANETTTTTEIVQKPRLRSILSCSNKKDTDTETATTKNRITRSQNHKIHFHKDTKFVTKTGKKLPVVPVRIPKPKINRQTVTIKENATRPINTTKVFIIREKAKDDTLSRSSTNGAFPANRENNLELKLNQNDGHIIVSPEPCDFDTDNVEDNQNINNYPHKCRLEARRNYESSSIMDDPGSPAEIENYNRNPLKIIVCNEDGVPILKDCCAVVFKEPDVNDLLEFARIAAGHRKNMDMDDASSDDSDDGLNWIISSSSGSDEAEILIDDEDLQQVIVINDNLKSSQDQGGPDFGHGQSPDNIIEIEPSPSASEEIEQVTLKSDSDTDNSTSSPNIDDYDKSQPEQDHEQEGNSDAESIEPIYTLRLVG